MKPFEVRAVLTQSLVALYPIAFDALLASVVARLRDYPPAALEYHGEEDLPIPLLKHERGFYHASEAHFTISGYDLKRWVRKLPELNRLAMLSKAKKMPVAGRYKAFWMPLRLILPAGSRLTWWGVGTITEVMDLLQHVLAIGGKRASGYGWVGKWEINEVDVDQSLYVADGIPARPLPIDMVPQSWSSFRTTRLMHPYWANDEAQLCAVPSPPIEEL